MIVKMKRFHLFFSGEPDSLLEKLQKEAIVEIDRLPEQFGFEKADIDKVTLEENISRLEFLKGVLKRIEGKDFSGKLVLTEAEEKNIIEEFPLADVYEKYLTLVSESNRREQVSAKIVQIKEELENIKDLQFAPIELYSLKNFSFCMFSLDKKSKNVPDNIEGFKVEKINEKKRQVILLVVFHKDIKEKVISEIESINGKILLLRRWNKKPAEVIKKLDSVYKKNEQLKREKDEEIKKLTSLKTDIFVYFDYLKSLVYYFEAKQELGFSRFVKGFSGWVQEEDVLKLKDFIKENMPNAYLQIETPSIDEDVPIAFKNKNIIEPFEVVTDLYGRPIYKNIDPTGPLSLFFAISFGFCMTDAGYGLIFVVLSTIFMKKFKVMPAVVKFLKLLLYGGISAIFMGAITGSWFGDLLTRLPENLLPIKVLKKFVVLDPLGGGNKAFIFLGWALIIGYIQIVWGLILNVYNNLKLHGFKNSGEAISLLAIQVLTGILIVSILLSNKGVIPNGLVMVPIVLLVGSFISLMVVKAVEQTGVVMKLFWAVYGAYNAIAGNLLGDILSYSRLFGLGLTTAVLGLVVNEMVFMSKAIPFAGYIIAVLLFIVGHIGNLAINLLGSYVHTSRLQYLEFFTKFFESGGRPFKPLAPARVYTYINKETK